jgi:hypothetical protein
VSGDLEEWIQCFSAGVTWQDWGYGFDNGWATQIQGRDAVREGMQSYLARYPEGALKYRPVSWYMVDEARGWVVWEARNRLRDPGNGEVFEEKFYSRLEYAGDQQWSLMDDIYNPVRLDTLLHVWRYVRGHCAAEGVALPDPMLQAPKALHSQVRDDDGDDRWTRDELQRAVDHFEEVGIRAFESGEREEWCQCFTEDVVHREHGFGYGTYEEELRGRDAVRRWINSFHGAFPIVHMVDFPMPWTVIDEQRGWVALEYLNIMEDPGDGRVYQERSRTRLKYAGDGKWRMEEDLYSPLRMRAMLDRWLDARARLSEGG